MAAARPQCCTISVPSYLTTAPAHRRPTAVATGTRACVRLNEIFRRQPRHPRVLDTVGLQVALGEPHRSLRDLSGTTTPGAVRLKQDGSV